MTKQISKSIAMALAAITLSLPFSTQALAASHQSNHPNPGHKVEWRHDQHRDQHHEYRQHQAQQMQHRHPAPPPKQEEKHHSRTGNLVTGVIIGGILGAIIAKNT